MEEEWRWAFEGYYEVSNFGRIRAVAGRPSWGNTTSNRKERILKIHNVKDRYAMIDLSIDAVKKTYTIHRLVALAFIPNPGNLPQVDHIDQDKHNNHISNLRWVSRSDNQQNRSNDTWSKMGEKYIRAVPKRQNLFQFQKTTDGITNVKFFKSLDEAKAFRLELLGF